jgi:hypothetical protein
MFPPFAIQDLADQGKGLPEKMVARVAKRQSPELQKAPSSPLSRQPSAPIPDPSPEHR